MQKYEYFEEIKRSKCSTTSQKKMDKCPAVEWGVPRYPPEKKERKKRAKMIAHGPSNKQYAKSWQVFNFQSLWSKSMAFLSSDPILITQ